MIPTRKPLGRKAYGSIGHLPTSRLGPGDHSCHEGQARIACEKARDRHDVVVVQEKLDGSCCAVALVDGELLALGRAGYLAQTSPYPMHQLFAHWVRENAERFRASLQEGEWIVGEWLAQAHGTRYALPHAPFVAFDLSVGGKRLPYEYFMRRVDGQLVTPRLISCGPPVSVEAVRVQLEPSGHGALDPVEGAVWRVERHQKAAVVDFLAKWVRPDKKDGSYLPEVSGGKAVWNWRPDA